MLAASPPGTNVAPNDLQAAPVLTCARVTLQQFHIQRTICRSQAQPDDLLQHYTPGLALAWRATDDRD